MVIVRGGCAGVKLPTVLGEYWRIMFATGEGKVISIKDSSLSVRQSW